MLTAWNKYKEKAAKEAAGKQPRVKTPESAEEVVKWLGKAIAKLDALDTAAIFIYLRMPVARHAL